jgi:hypothetical protein
LSGTYAVFSLADGFVHDVFLEKNNFLNWRFHAKITSGDHDSIRTCNNFVQVMNGFMVFDFADKMDIRTMLRIFLNKELSQ